MPSQLFLEFRFFWTTLYQHSFQNFVQEKIIYGYDKTNDNMLIFNIFIQCLKLNEESCVLFL